MPSKTCPQCSNIVANNKKICFCGYKFDINYLSLEEQYPELIKEWDYQKNSYNPNGYTPFSLEKVYWICSNHHSYISYIMNRTKHSYGCPYCSGQKILKGFNDLQTTDPILCKEWNYEINKLDPSNYSRGSNKTVSWKCKNNHIWNSKIGNRTFLNRGCPYCTHQKIIIGENDLKTLHPILIKEWDYNKNKIDPEYYFPSSKYKVYWICPNGHSYISRISNRTNLNRGCPICRQSKGERKVKDILDQLNIKYIQQYTYNDCCYKRTLKFDFYIPKYNLIIEYQGIQHYLEDHKNSYYHNDSRHTDEDLKNINKKDKIKENYCKINNINILYIPYTQYDDIKLLILEKIDEINNYKN